MIQIGDIVRYRLSDMDSVGINRRRDHAANNMNMMRVQKLGYQAHVGDVVSTGEIVSLIVTRVWSDTRVNGQAILDGTDSLWVLSILEGDDPGTWSHHI